MPQVLIIYASDYGSTGKMARRVAAGVDSVEGCRARLAEAEAATAEDVLAADALIFGSPVHMGAMDWRIKRFIDKVCGHLWMQDKLVGRVGAVFASGGGYGNAGTGCELAMLSMLNNLVELGLIIAPLPRNTPGFAKGGLQWGPYGRSLKETGEPFEGGVPDERIESAYHHGANVARLAKALKGLSLFAS